MSASRDLRLFEPGDAISPEQLRADEQGALAPMQAVRRPDLDAARMWISHDDGQLVRGVKPHSAEKARMVSRGLDTVSSAMGKKWFARRHGLVYLELFCGPGRLLDERTGTELAGSPIQALQVRQPFTRYVFSDFAQECVDALASRVGSRDDVEIVQGDANDERHLEHLAGLFDDKALVIAYLDPARPADLRWSTVEFLARRFRYTDLIINLPVNSLIRAILGAYTAGGRGPGVAGLFLNHDAPHELLRPGPDRVAMAATIDAVRTHYDEQLELLGFRRPARRTVQFPAANPYYDILLASRHPVGLDLWNRTNPPPEDPQLSFDEG